MHRIALVDMDGTLADYDFAMAKALEELRDPSEPDRSREHGTFPAWIEARRQLIGLKPGFWRNLPKLPLGFDILDRLEKHGFVVSVITKGPSTKPMAWSEKLEWCREHLPGKQVTITEDKSHTYGRILVDDWTPYFMGWLRFRPRGIVIVPAQPWNVDAESLSPNIYRYDGSEPHILDSILDAVSKREDGESINLDEIRRSQPA